MDTSSPGKPLSGRVGLPPEDLLNEMILRPQFDYEVQHLLDFYVMTEKVYARQAAMLGILSDEDVQTIIAALNDISADDLRADASTNMSDITFAIEQLVTERIKTVPPGWHVEKSRNDYQSCVQRMFARKIVLDCVHLGLGLCDMLVSRAKETVDLPMPGFTHFQSAQVVSPGFYLASMNEPCITSMRRLIRVYDELNLCPLGSGAMAGLEHPWDRQYLATSLGFERPVRSSLVSVADRDWLLMIGFEFALFGELVSRFCTDLMFWGSSQCGFIDLPDSMVSISSVMPQKRNLTVLERIRGATAHLLAFHVDFLVGQRSTLYTNLVEVSKEAARHLVPAFDCMSRVIGLMTLVAENVTFVPEKMARACEQGYCGAFALANLLTMQEHIPHRTAQVIVGELVRDAVQGNILPPQLEIGKLRDICGDHGYRVTVSEERLRLCFEPQVSLREKRTSGGSHPDSVRTMLALQVEDIENVRRNYDARLRRVHEALESL